MTQFPQGQSNQEPDRGVLVLVLGILSLTVCALLGPVSWMMGKGDLAKMNTGQMSSNGRGITQGGMICGIVGTVFLGLGLLWILFVLVIGVGALATAAP